MTQAEEEDSALSNTRSFWVAGASHGVGLALVSRLLDKGHRVAASGKDRQKLEALKQRHGDALLVLDSQLQYEHGAVTAAEQMVRALGKLDGLIVNAGSCDYLPNAVKANELIEAIMLSNLDAAQHCLHQALPLLAKGDKPQVMAVFSRYSALQRFEPTQPVKGSNNAPQWFREQRTYLHQQGIDLTVVAPDSLKVPIAEVIQAQPEAWTAESAAAELVERLARRQPELVLEVLDPSELWPLPE